MPTGLIEIQDEVNVRFLGVPKDLIIDAQKELTYWAANYMHMPAYKGNLGNWDGKIRLMGKTGKTYLNLIDSVLPVFEAAGYDFEIDDLRHDWSEVTNSLVLPKDDIFGDHEWDDGTPIVLRDYQLEAVHAAVNNGQGLLEMATGAGKTLVCATISKVYSDHGKVIVIVPNIDLAIQTQALFKRVGLDPGIWYGEMKDDKQITISTWQSLDHYPELMAEVVCVIVDECLHGDTPVLTPTGYVPISKIAVGDMVISRNDDGQYVSNPVIRVHRNITPPSEPFYQLEMECGAIIKVTGNHKFLTTDGWVRADCLTEDHDIISLDSAEIGGIDK